MVWIRRGCDIRSALGVLAYTGTDTDVMRRPPMVGVPCASIEFVAASSSGGPGYMAPEQLDWPLNNEASVLVSR